MEGVRKSNKESSNTGEDAGPGLAARHGAGSNVTAESSMPAHVTPEDAVARPTHYSRQMPSFSSSQESTSVASRRLSRFCRNTSGVLSLQEIFKEKQV